MKSAFVVLKASSLHLSAVLSTQYASTVVFLCRDLPLSVVFYVPNSSRRGQEQQHLSSSLLTIYQLYISLTVARSTSVHISPLSVTLPSVCCCLGSRARVWTHSRSYASAACSLCQCMSSCTGVGEGSTRKGHRLPCCKLSTWRQFPSEG